MNVRPLFVAVAAAAVIGGFFAGTSLATATTDEKPPVRVTPGKYAEDLAPYEKLSNGKAAGNYRLETPLDQRPDFVPTRTSDGKPGYLKREHFDDREVEGVEVGDGVRVIRGEDLVRAKEAERRALKPDANGETWAPVYGADGETVIGRALLNSPEPR